MSFEAYAEASVSGADQLDSGYAAQVSLPKGYKTSTPTSRTLTRPSLPIYIGTRGPKLLELTGEMADGVLSESLFSGDGMSYVREHVTAGVIRSQRSLRDVDIVSWQLVRVTTHLHDAAADCFCAYHPVLEAALLPQVEQIISGVFPRDDDGKTPGVRNVYVSVVPMKMNGKATTTAPSASGHR
jgi:hypothetical protein